MVRITVSYDDQEELEYVINKMKADVKRQTKEHQGEKHKTVYLFLKDIAKKC